MAEPAVSLQDTAEAPATPASARRVRDRRWSLLQRALTARGAPFGGMVLIVAVLVAMFAPFIAPYDPLKQDLSNILLPPSGEHLLGTDNLGRDIVARVLFGTRVSLIAGLASVTV